MDLAQILKPLLVDHSNSSSLMFIFSATPSAAPAFAEFFVVVPTENRTVFPSSLS